MFYKSDSSSKKAMVEGTQALYSVSAYCNMNSIQFSSLMLTNQSMWKYVDYLYWEKHTHLNTGLNFQESV